MPQLVYRAPATVKRFLEDDSRYRCIVGPFGSGKSSGCVMEILRRAYAQRPSPDGVRRSRWAVIRNTKPQLRDTTRKTFEKWLLPYGRFREAPLEFYLRAPGVEADVLFRALDEPKDVRNLLSLELTGAYFNEVREIARDIWDGMSGRIGRYPSMDLGGPSWSGIWADSNPWYTGSWQWELFEDRKQRGAQLYAPLYRQPSGLAPDAENVENLEAGYYENLCAGKSDAWIDLYVHGLNGVSDEGSVFGKWIERLRMSGRLLDFPHPAHDVFTTWDLGLADSTAIWWWRAIPTGVEVLDWYENSGEDLSHYFGVLEERAAKYRWTYVKHWLPHDARAKTLATGNSVLAQFLERYPNKVSIGPDLSTADGVEAGRWLLQQPGTRFHLRAEEGLKRLSEYRFQWDDLHQVYSRQPLHDRASHTGDAWRYVGNCAKKTGLVAARSAAKDDRYRDVGGIKIIRPGQGPQLPSGSVQPNGRLNIDLQTLFSASDRRRR